MVLRFEGLGEVGRAVGSLGWEMEFWPGMVSPLARPAQMWWVKFVLIAGRTAMHEGMSQMLERRYMALSKEPEKRRALSDRHH